MNDPFFQEDDGEFDDLYGKPRPSTTSRKLSNSEPLTSQLNSPNTRSFRTSFGASSSVLSISYAHERTRSSASNTTDGVVTAKQHKRIKTYAKSRRKGSKELFNVQWEESVKAVKCGLCKSDFSFVKRKHHCRHCGRVMCSDCSSFLYFELTHRKHRVCVTCNNQLLTEQDDYERKATMESNLNASSSDDSRPLSSLQPLEDDKKASNRQGYKHKEENEKESRYAGVRDPKTAAGAALSRKQTNDVDRQSILNEALFDCADEGWFTEVPDQEIRSREGYSDDGHSTKPSWRDRVKDTYTVTSTTENLAPLTQNTLTAGITGKGYISDQFRYDDISGPGLGHDDDMSLEMPRPEQQVVAPLSTDYYLKSTHFTDNGYVSEQYQYNVVGGSEPDHDEIHPDAMSWPKQSIAITPLMEKNDLKREQSKADATDDSSSQGQDSQPWLSFANIFKSTKRRESLTKKKEKNAKASQSRAHGNENMTLDELNPSYSSQDDPCLLQPTVSTSTTARSTFYDQNADKEVVDDSPGYFEAAMAEREAQNKKEAKQNEQFTRRNTSALPPSTRPRRFSSGHDSYSIVDPPSQTSSSPVEKRTAADVNDTETKGKSSKSFSVALKRFFGVRSKKTTTPIQSARTPPAIEEVDLSKAEHTKKNAFSLQKNTSNSSVLTNAVSGGLSRATIAASNGFLRDEGVIKRHRYTIAEGHFHAEASSSVLVGEATQQQQAQEPARIRRGTFDELFMSPKSFTDQYNSEGAREWIAHEKSDSSRVSASVVGVARFDQPKSVNEGKEVMIGIGNEVLSDGLSVQFARYSTEAWRESAVLSLLNDKQTAAQREDSSFTWSKIRSVPGLETATYAVPLSLQSRTSYDDKLGSVAPYEISSTQSSAPLGSIMDAYKYESSSRQSKDKDSIDDFFASFEETNDYVFDSTSGSYVAARIPARELSASRRVDPSTLQMTEKRKTELDHNFASSAFVSSDNDCVDDEVHEIIVDKISTLESELAALKQLIRNRKSSGSLQSTKRRGTRYDTKSSNRKQSIFESSSSEEENEKTRKKWKTRQSAGKIKQTLVPQRKSSFADLFDDSPTGTSYEALFQIEGKVGGTSTGDESDQDADPTLHPMAVAPKRLSDRSPHTSVIAFDSKADIASLQERRGETHQDNDLSLVLKETPQGTLSSKLDGTQKGSKDPAEEEDSIDALFNALKDHDVAKLYQNDDGDGEDDSPFVLSVSTNDVKDTSVAPGAALESVEPMNGFELSSSYPVKSRDVVESIQDEGDFSINWSKMQTLKSQRLKFRRGESRASTDTTTKGAQVIPNLFDEEVNVKVADVPAKHVVPVSILREEMSTAAVPEKENVDVDGVGHENEASRLGNKDIEFGAVSMAAAEKENVDVDGVGHENEASRLGNKDIEFGAVSMAAAEKEDVDVDGIGQENVAYWLGDKDIEFVAAAMVTETENKSDDEDNAPSKASPMIVSPVEKARSNLRTTSREMRDDAAVDVLLSNVVLISDTDVKTLLQDDATFDIFDKSSDLPIPSLLAEHIDGSDESDDVDNAEKNEAFSFEIQASTKTLGVHVDMPTSSSSAQAVVEPSPPTPTSSAAENVAFGKYATVATVPLQFSSHTSSMDGSQDGGNAVVFDDEPVLGKAESEAFDADWQQLQAKEKERKKRLQVKQRQAQRDKLLRKQGSSVSMHDSSKSKSKSGKKKKKERVHDSTATISSHSKKNASSRGNRRDAEEKASGEPLRSLTEL
ncbi:hypothetical protein PsorP6_008935 [Peronosclerospora sorghi]|uniref:Uncharacterized protein n=1 Tax=Peronosclerospora sorghi TaxID=230839 RepID=A0ACC0W0G4_9STRA|nr:hypothetical protein PsorP6_008935 [Peronosclerospora sorghi]